MMPGPDPSTLLKSVGSDAKPEDAPVVHRPHRLLGAQLGDFFIQERIARGSMGEVFLATQLSLDRKVALKSVSSKIARKPDMVQRFLREMRWLAQLDHPQIVKVFAAGEHEGMPYAALEFVSGHNLQHWLSELNSLAISDAVHITLLCAEALRHAHAKGIIHRDVKPANVLISNIGEVKLTDFGLVKAAIEDVSLTRTGIGLGTPSFMAPEQIRDAKHADVRTDIYALGSMLYQLLTGEFPFPKTELALLLKAKLHGKPAAARSLNPHIPEKLDLIVSKMLERNPDFRYSTCDELLHDLGALGLARESLDFIQSPDKVKVQRSWTLPAPAAAPVRQKPRRDLLPKAKPFEQSEISAHTPIGHRMPTSAKRERSAASREALWFVRHKDGREQISVHEMSTDEVLRGIETKYLDINATAKSSANDMFRPLREFDAFRRPMDKRLSKAKVIRRGSKHTAPWFARRGFWIAFSMLTVLAGSAYFAWASQTP